MSYEWMPHIELPITWEPLPPLRDIDDALVADAPNLHDASPGNVAPGAAAKKKDARR